MKVLIVEDDRNLRGFLRKAFREEGYATDECESGDRAVDRALKRPYDCIVLDLMLPGLDGFEVVEELRRRTVLTPVLILTARDEVGSRVRGLEAGADDYLPKPFDLAELMARVHALIRRAAFRHGDATLAVGDITLDSLERRVMRGGSWNDPPERCRSAYRNAINPNHGYETTGFRVVATRANPKRN